MREQSSGHWAWGMSKWRPRLSRGALADGGADALGVDESMREVGLSVRGPPGLGYAE